MDTKRGEAARTKSPPISKIPTHIDGKDILSLAYATTAAVTTFLNGIEHIQDPATEEG